MTQIWNRITDFFGRGDNLYYAIGVVIVVVVLIIVVSLITKNKKKIRARQEEELSSFVEQSGEEKEVNIVESEPTPLTASPSKVEVAAPSPQKDEKVQPSKTEDGKKAELKEKEERKDKDTKLSKVVEVVKVEHKKKPQPPAKEEEPKETVKAESSPEEEENKLRRPGVVQIYIDNGGKFRFRFKASNNETVGHSQGYATKYSCQNGIKAVQRAVETAETIDTIMDKDYKITIGVPCFEIYRDNENKFRFRLRAANTHNILASQGYTTKENCINGIRSVTNIAGNHRLQDDTLKRNKE